LVIRALLRRTGSHFGGSRSRKKRQTPCINGEFEAATTEQRTSAGPQEARAGALQAAFRFQDILESTE
jgi:hypothetical protein